MNPFDQLREAVATAKATINAADNAATDIARLLVGRVRKIHDTEALKAIKRELRKFNIHTGRWAD